MRTKIPVMLVIALLVAAGIGHLLPLLGYPIRKNIPDLFLAAGQLLGIFIMLLKGSLTETVYFKVIQVFLAGLIIGFLLWHLPDPVYNPLVLMLGSLIGIGITYTWWFFQKSYKDSLDILKVLWVLSTTVWSVGIFLRWIPRTTTFVPTLLFWIVLLQFILLEVRIKRVYRR